MKKNIVGLMLKTPESIQRQLSDAITFIGKGRKRGEGRGREGRGGEGRREEEEGEGGGG